MRNDVVALLEDLIGTTPNPAWMGDYVRARLAMARVCGFLATNTLYDQDLFDDAMRVYCEAVGL